MKKRILGALIIGAFIFAGIVTLPGCEKEQGFVVVFVNVIDEAGYKMPNVYVRIFQDTLERESNGQTIKANISSEGNTGSNGQSIHTLDNTKAILFVEAIHGALKAIDIVRVEPNGQVEKTMVIRR